jgi:uncharacterized RDD family membrane protein YckC
MNDDAPAMPPMVRPALGRPGVDWSGDGGLGGATREQAEVPRGIVPASVGLRAAGFVIDMMVLLGIAVLVSTVVLLFAGVDTSAPQDEMQREIEDLYPLMYVVEGGVQFVYNLVWNSIGWSPGKWMLRLRTVDAAGNPPRLRRGLVRTLGSILSGSFFGLGYAWAIWDREHRTWHDRIARTYVVRLPAEDDSGPPRRGS